MPQTRNLRLSADFFIDADGSMDIHHDGKTYRLVRPLKHDQWAAVALMECEGPPGPLRHVLKISRCNGRFEQLLAPIMNYVSRREYDIYKVCDGIQGVPPLGARVGKNAFLHEYVEGDTLDRRDDVLPEFFDQLEDILHRVHERGVAYVDMAKRENIIVGDDGRPYLIDFQISFMRRSGPFSWLRSALVWTFQREDRYHLVKHRDRMLRRTIPGYRQQYQEHRTLLTRIHCLLIRRPYLAVKRIFVPKHGDTTVYR